MWGNVHRRVRVSLPSLRGVVCCPRASFGQSTETYDDVAVSMTWPKIISYRLCRHSSPRRSPAADAPSQHRSATLFQLGSWIRDDALLELDYPPSYPSPPLTEIAFLGCLADACHWMRAGMADARDNRIRAHLGLMFYTIGFMRCLGNEYVRIPIKRGQSVAY